MNKTMNNKEIMRMVKYLSRAIKKIGKYDKKNTNK